MQQQKTNGLAVAGLITAFFIPLIGLILSIVGLSKSKERGGKGLAVAGIVISILVGIGQITLVAGIFKAVDDVVNDGSSSSATKSEDEYRFQDRADKQGTDVELALGETGDIDGVKITVNSAEHKNSLGEFSNAPDGKTYLVVNVSLENTSDETKAYNGFDFRIQTAGGQVLDQDFESVEPRLGSGDIVAGGNTTGNVVFEVPEEDGHQYVIWKPSAWDSRRAIIQVE